jgi:hypothetical protein
MSGFHHCHDERNQNLKTGLNPIKTKLKRFDRLTGGKKSLTFSAMSAICILLSEGGPCCAEGLSNGPVGLCRNDDVMDGWGCL